MGGGAVGRGADTRDRHCLPLLLPARLPICWGFLSWGGHGRGIPASHFLSQQLLGSYPAAPHTHKGRPASPHHMQIVGKFTSVSF